MKYCSIFYRQVNVMKLYIMLFRMNRLKVAVMLHTVSWKYIERFLHIAIYFQLHKQ